jgi:UrcA family protein
MFKLMEKAAEIGLVALAALPLVSLGAAHAQTATVKISDLDLNQPAQAAVFERRLDRAAAKVCMERAGSSLDLTSMAVCKAAVRAEAMDKLAAYERLAAEATPVKVASR